jgi:hypothetical protein
MARENRPKSIPARRDSRSEVHRMPHLNREHPIPFGRRCVLVRASGRRARARRTCWQKCRCTLRLRRAKGRGAGLAGLRRGRPSASCHRARRSFGTASRVSAVHSWRKPEAVIEPPGNAGAAATLSRSGVSGPIASRAGIGRAVEGFRIQMISSGMTSDRHHEQIFVKDTLQPKIPGCLPEPGNRQPRSKSHGEAR